MFGVNRWGGHEVQDITEAAAQARLEAWKRKAKEREEAKQKQEGLKVSNGAVVKAARKDERTRTTKDESKGSKSGSKPKKGIKDKSEAERDSRGKRKKGANEPVDHQAKRRVEKTQHSDSNGGQSHKSNAEGSHGKDREQMKRSATNGNVVESASPVADAKKVLSASNGVHEDVNGGAKPKVKTAGEKPAANAAEFEAKRAAEIARAERRELKRRKEVERAHDIIGKKAKKARKGGVVPVADDAVVPVDAAVVPVAEAADEEDEEQVREERRRLKRQKREERKQRRSGVEVGSGRDEQEMKKAVDTRTVSVSQGGSGEEPGVKRKKRASNGDVKHEAGRNEQEPEVVGDTRMVSMSQGVSEGEPGVNAENAAGDQKAGDLEAAEHRKRKRRKEGIAGSASDQLAGVVVEVEDERKPGEQLESAVNEDSGLGLSAQDSGSREEQPTRVGEGDPPENRETEAAQVKKPEVPVKGPPLLPWMRAPIEIGEDEGLELSLVPGLDGMLKGALEKAGITGLFPVQAAVWKEMVASGAEDHDLCVCAPTGSGKTFAYALPICQGLSQRIVRRLRALVVLPTRDLASQVKGVFDLLAPSIGLSVGLAVGQTSLAGEAQQLVSSGRSFPRDFTPDGEPALAESNVDILVCTPGRLMDHVHDTPGFTLQHLRYLVVDETDRLLRQAYQDWLPIVLSAASASISQGHVSTIRRPIPERGIRTPVPRVVKLILSATLTRDPAKIQQLQLHRPRYIATSATDHRYKVPQQLQEFRLVCTAGEKPLYLVALLHQLKGQPTIVFTASVEATHRLFTLLQAFEGLPVVVGEYSSLQPQRVRGAVLEGFRRGEVAVLVSSDAMTRGMDVEGVKNVVSYDAPVYAKTYVHRAGRTARAGRSGRCFTLLRKEEVRHFKGLLRKVDNNFCPDYPLPPGATEELVPFYTAALEKLKETVAGESAGGGGT